MKRCLEITDRLIRIKQEFEQLGTKFIKAGERLHVENILPSRDLLDELDTARENFDDLIRQMSKYAAELEEKIDIARFDSLLEIEKVWSNMIDERYEEKKMAMTDSMPSGENGKKTLHFQGNLEECLFSLLGEHKYGPAFWIAHYCKQKHGKTPVPPLLIKALELSRVIQGEDGPAASWLSIVYSDFEFYSYLDFEEKDQSDLVRKLLFLAALLRPAYVAPESGALSLIIKIKWAAKPKKLWLIILTTAAILVLDDLFQSFFASMKPKTIWEKIIGVLKIMANPVLAISSVHGVAR